MLSQSHYTLINLRCKNTDVEAAQFLINKDKNYITVTIKNWVYMRAFKIIRN